MMQIRVVINKLLLRTKPAQYREYLIPVSTMPPRLESCVLDLGIQNGCHMDQRHVFYIPVEGYYRKNQITAQLKLDSWLEE
jgi:hypothetical protein